MSIEMMAFDLAAAVVGGAIGAVLVLWWKGYFKKDSW